MMPAEHIQSLINNVHLQLQSAQFTDAIIVCNYILREHENCKSALYLKGKAHLQLQEYSQAINCLKRYIKLHSGDSNACYELGVAYEKKRLYRKAAKYYSDAILKNSAFTDAKTALARVSQKLPQIAQAQINYSSNSNDEDDFVFLGEKKEQEEQDLLQQKQLVCSLFNERLFINIENFLKVAKTSSNKLFLTETVSPVSTGARLINYAAAALSPVTALVVTLFGTSASIISDQQQLMHLGKLGSILSDEDVEDIARKISNEITLRYAHCLSRIDIQQVDTTLVLKVLEKLELTEYDVLYKLVKFALSKVVDYVLNRNGQFFKQTLAHDLVQVICEAEPSWTTQLISKLGIDTINTYSSNEKFEASQFFSSPGIMLSTGETYCNKKMNPDLYGYRLGTLDEVKEDLKPEDKPKRQIIPLLFFHGYFTSMPTKQEKSKQLEQKVTRLEEKVEQLTNENQGLKQELSDMKKQLEQQAKQMEQFQKFMEQQLSHSPSSPQFN